MFQDQPIVVFKNPYPSCTKQRFTAAAFKSFQMFHLKVPVRTRSKAEYNTYRAAPSLSPPPCRTPFWSILSTGVGRRAECCSPLHLQQLEQLQQVGEWWQLIRCSSGPCDPLDPLQGTLLHLYAFKRHSDPGNPSQFWGCKGASQGGAHSSSPPFFLKTTPWEWLNRFCLVPASFLILFWYFLHFPFVVKWLP